jgi:hypothetical protein
VCSNFAWSRLHLLEPTSLQAIPSEPQKPANLTELESQACTRRTKASVSTSFSPYRRNPPSVLGGLGSKPLRSSKRTASTLSTRSSPALWNPPVHLRFPDAIKKGGIRELKRPQQKVAWCSEKAGLHRDAIRSQCSTCSRHKKETGDEED